MIMCCGFWPIQFLFMAYDQYKWMIYNDYKTTTKFNYRNSLRKDFAEHLMSIMGKGCARKKNTSKNLMNGEGHEYLHC